MVDLVFQSLCEQLGCLDPDLFPLVSSPLQVTDTAASPDRCSGDAQAPFVDGAFSAFPDYLGLIRQRGSSSGIPMTMMRSGTPTCGPASPTPDAARIVSIMFLASVGMEASMAVMRFAFRRSTGSGTVRIGRTAIFLQLHYSQLAQWGQNRGQSGPTGSMSTDQPFGIGMSRGILKGGNLGG